MTIWHIASSFGTFFKVLVSCTKKNLATLHTVHLSILSFLCLKENGGYAGDDDYGPPSCLDCDVRSSKHV
jgi:hypothetical protein